MADGEISRAITVHLFSQLTRQLVHALLLKVTTTVADLAVVAIVDAVVDVVCQLSFLVVAAAVVGSLVAVSCSPVGSPSSV